MDWSYFKFGRFHCQCKGDSRMNIFMLSDQQFRVLLVHFFRCMGVFWNWVLGRQHAKCESVLKIDLTDTNILTTVLLYSLRSYYHVYHATAILFNVCWHYITYTVFVWQKTHQNKTNAFASKKYGLCRNSVGNVGVLSVFRTIHPVCLTNYQSSVPELSV